jgi:hypothetical protein
LRWWLLLPTRYENNNWFVTAATVPCAGRDRSHTSYDVILSFNGHSPDRASNALHAQKIRNRCEFEMRLQRIGQSWLGISDPLATAISFWNRTENLVFFSKIRAFQFSLTKSDRLHNRTVIFGVFTSAEELRVINQLSGKRVLEDAGSMFQ